MSLRLADTISAMPVGLKLGATMMGVCLVVSVSMLLLFHDVSMRHIVASLETSLGNELWHIQRRVDHLLKPHGAGGPAQTRQALERGMAHFAPGRTPGGSFAFVADEHGRVLAAHHYRDALLPDKRAIKALLLRGRGFTSLSTPEGDIWLRFDKERNSGLLLVVQLSDDQARALFHRAKLTVFWLALVGSAVLAAVAIVALRRGVARPLRRLTAEAERVAAGDLTPPAALPRRDELGRLSAALRKLTISAQEMIHSAEANEARFRQLFSDSRDAAFIVGHDGRLSDVNAAALKVFGYDSRQEMLDLPDTGPVFADEDQRQAYLRDIFAQGYVQDYRVTMRRKSGQTFEALITATAGGGGEARFGLVRDITEMAQAQAELRASEERYRRLVENAPGIVYRWCIDTKRFEYLNSTVERITGYKADDIIGDNDIMVRAIPPDQRQRVLQNWLSQIGGETPAVREQQFAIRDCQGELHWFLERSILVRDDQGQPTYLEGIGFEITERKRLEEALREGQMMIEATLASLPVPVMVIDSRHKVVHWNRAMERISGRAASEVIGTSDHWRPFYPDIHPTLADLVLDGDYDAMEKHYGAKGLRRSSLVEGSIECEDLFWGESGHGRHLYFIAAPIKDEHGRVIRAVETLIDITDQKNLEQELRLLSVTDELTGLYNKRFFHATVDREMEIARRFGQPLALLMLDLDRFKQYNDTFGHLEGDKALAQFAGVVRGVVRAADLPCRYGGEEFAVLLPRTERAEAMVVAERIRAAVEAMDLWPVAADGQRQKRHVTVSIGVACLRGDLNQDRLINLADQALYAAKQAGRNQVIGECPLARGGRD